MKPDNLSFTATLILILLAAFLPGGCTLKDSTPTVGKTDVPCISRGWPHDGTDLQADPVLRFGTLENGLRYVIMRNEEPEDRVGMFLNIQAGSLEEEDDQRGYAHFLEHMLFNGTDNYPPGTLVEYFQSIGMAFGSDTNAHTNFDETVYHLLLPEGTEGKLRDGLLVLADYARGALLLEEEVERERGIILAEKRTRDSAGYRLYEKRMRFLLSGTRVTERFPIGTDEALRRADAESLRSFYDAWYRPENMILVVVGDVDADLVEKLIGERFGALAAPPVHPECYEFGMVEESGEQFLYVHEPEIGSTEISISSNRNTRPVKDSIARQRKELKRHVAASLLQNRLKQLVRDSGSILTKADTYSGDFLQRVDYASLTGTVEGQNWQEGLDLLAFTLRQALDLGFSPRELERVKKEVMADLEKEVRTKASRDSRKLARKIIGALNDNRVLLSPEQEMKLYGPAISSMTIEDANAAFREMWGHGSRKVIVAGTAKVDGGETPEKELRAVYEQARTKELMHWKENSRVAFPYLPQPDTVHSVARKETFEAIGLGRYTFANGTVLHVKETDFQPNEVLVDVHFGQGKRSETKPGLGMLAETVVNESGVGRLTRNELEDALAGHNIQVSFKIGAESFILQGGGLSSELELLLQLFRAKLLDPAFREDAYTLTMERASQMYEQLSSTVEGMMRLGGEQFLAGGNPHYGMPPEAEFRQLTLDQARDWLVPVFAGAPLEISIVGDFDHGQAVELVGQYFGTLERRYEQELTETPVQFPSGESLSERVVTQVDKALVTVAWPTDDFWDISRTRRLNILAAVFDDRLRVEIREKLGAAYSPQVFNHSSRTEEGYGVMRAMLTVDPAKANEVSLRVREVGRELAADGVTDEELARSLEPVLTSIKDMVRTNRYWMESVVTLSSRHPQQLEWPMTIQSDFSSISPGEISDFAARYLGPENAAEILYLPAAE